MSWIVVITPCLIPMPSWITLTMGARQLVVQDAAVTILCRLGQTNCHLLQRLHLALHLLSQEPKLILF